MARHPSKTTHNESFRRNNVFLKVSIEEVEESMKLSYSSTDLTFELKSLIFVEIEILDAFHTLLRLAKAVLAFPIFVLTSASVPPFPSIILPR